jgi:DNA-binding PadR family transcriptional regulator
MPIFEARRRRKRWYQEAHIKEPPLQIKILKHIALEGQLSKNMAKEITGSDYSDVSNAIDSLLQRKMIKISSLGMEGRKDRKYYALTEKGLEAFLNDNYLSSKKYTTEDFWKAIIWYCIKKPQITSLSEIEKYCSYFEHIYLGHRAVNSYLFQSKFFENLVRKWIKENGSFDDSISIFQRILECIATSRNLTIQQLYDMAGGEEEKHNIKEILDKFAFRINYINNNQQRDASNYSSNKSKYPDLKYILIIEKKEEGVNRDIVYELSLFGIMLIVAIIRHHHIGVDSNRIDSNGDNNRLQLFFEDIPMEEYMDKISSNYPDKIPLVFGKWNLLKKELGSSFIYDNFDFMFYDKAYAVNMSTSIWQGGNKEFCDSLQSLAERSRSMLRILHMEGRDILESFIENKEVKENGSKLLGIYLKINEIKTVLQYLNNEQFSNSTFDKIKTFQNEIEKHQDKNLPTNIIAFLERVFSDEITLFFYLNLNNSAFITSKSYSQINSPVVQSRVEGEDPDNIVDFSSLLVAEDIFSHGSPKDRLTNLFKKDKDIGKNFYNLMNISMNYQKETSDKMFENIKKIGINENEDKDPS